MIGGSGSGLGSNLDLSDMTGSVFSLDGDIGETISGITEGLPRSGKTFLLYPIDTLLFVDMLLFIGDMLGGDGAGLIVDFFAADHVFGLSIKLDFSARNGTLTGTVKLMRFLAKLVFIAY